MTIATPAQRAEYAEEMADLWQKTAKAAKAEREEKAERLEDWKLAAQLLASRGMLQKIQAMGEEQRSATLATLGAVKAWRIVCELVS